MTALPRLLEPTELQPLLQRPDVVLITVCSAERYAEAHIPGSLHVLPAELQHGQAPAPGLLPNAERLSTLFSRLGLSPEKTVVACDDEGGPWAGRLLWTLTLLGHDRWAFLNGGLRAWEADGLPTTTEPTPLPTPTAFAAHIDEQYRISTDALLAALDDPQLKVWDTRSRAEYTGEKAVSRRGGHIPGAIHLEWTELLDSERHLRLKPLPQIDALLTEHGFTRSQSIVTHCQTHRRSGLSWLVGQLLGYEVIAYDGSWGDWGNRDDTPIHTGDQA